MFVLLTVMAPSYHSVSNSKLLMFLLTQITCLLMLCLNVTVTLHQVERDQLSRKVEELEDQIEKLESENLSLKTRLANLERDSKRPIQEYADFQAMNQKLQVSRLQFFPSVEMLWKLSCITSILVRAKGAQIQTRRIKPNLSTQYPISCALYFSLYLKIA